VKVICHQMLRFVNYGQPIKQPNLTDVLPLYRNAAARPLFSNIGQ
jgi:hypothetical protein